VTAAGWGYLAAVATLAALAAYSAWVARTYTHTPAPFDVFTDQPGDDHA
jgi:hypothetical protein